MTRYIRQQDEYSCGPHAIINAMKWLGMPATAADLPRLKEECHTTVGGGTWPKDLNIAIRKNIPRVRWIIGPSLPQLDHYLSQGRAVILGYSYQQDDGVEDAHFTLVIGNERAITITRERLDDPVDTYFMVNDVNPADGEIIGAQSLKTRDEMHAALYYINQDGDRAEVWFI